MLKRGPWDISFILSAVNAQLVLAYALKAELRQEHDP